MRPLLEIQSPREDLEQLHGSGGLPWWWVDGDG